jgi:hypothetical protein
MNTLIFLSIAENVVYFIALLALIQLQATNKQTEINRKRISQLETNENLKTVTTILNVNNDSSINCG